MTTRNCILALVALLGSCAAPQQQHWARSEKAERQYRELIGDKVPLRPVSCLPYYNTNDMVVIDDHTVAFRVANNRVYVNNMQGGCYYLGGPYTLVTRNVGSTGLCHGDIGIVEDVTNHYSVGSCVFGDFTPYVKPGLKQ